MDSIVLVEEVVKTYICSLLNLWPTGSHTQQLCDNNVFFMFVVIFAQ